MKTFINFEEAEKTSTSLLKAKLSYSRSSCFVVPLYMLLSRQICMLLCSLPFQRRLLAKHCWLRNGHADISFTAESKMDKVQVYLNFSLS